MTDKPRAADESAPGGTAPRDRSDGNADRIVVRDKRKIDSKGTAKPAKGEQGEDLAAGAETVAAAQAASAGDAAAAGDATAAGGQVDADPEVAEPEVVEPEVVEAEVVDVEVIDVEPVQNKEPKRSAETEALRSDLEERTRDLQRVTAEYANYRKRVDRDRGLVAEQTTGAVISALLPVLDDLDRAREHGDLVGPFNSMAEQLIAALGKFGLTAFGEKGDPFDPTRHEAVAHMTSADVKEPTCIDVMRRGYQLGDRLLRPALVAVADPE
jgi:molecular chaperone GrpE